MKKFLLASTAAVGALALASTAQAEFTVDATIDKEKTVTVTETITVNKFVEIFADVFSLPDKAAEALALVNQENFDNEACSNCAEKTDLINNSFVGNSGIVTWNQTTGNMNNQGNAVAVSVDFTGGTPPPPPNGTLTDDPGFADAQSHGEQRVENNEIESVNIVFRDAFLNNSANTNSGILLLNQSAGNINNQANSVAIAVSFSNEGVALAESDLGQWTTGNTILESDLNFDDPEGAPVFVGINKTAEINSSLNSNSGVIGFNQTVGNASNQGNFFSVASVSGTGS
jgi:hypothetical protein